MGIGSMGCRILNTTAAPSAFFRGLSYFLFFSSETRKRGAIAAHIATIDKPKNRKMFSTGRAAGPY
jgi:hypothetical protein